MDGSLDIVATIQPNPLQNKSPLPQWRNMASGGKTSQPKKTGAIGSQAGSSK
jgi:hypothetical protein